MAIDIRKSLKKYHPHLMAAAADNLNEADTVQRLVKVFEDVLGYDALSEISRESAIKDKFVDVALKVDGAVRLLVEAKSAGTVLRDRHIDQAQAYAAHSNIRWVLLTNSVMWNLYHLTFEDGIESTLAFSVDLSKGIEDHGAELLALLHRNSVRKGDLDAYWVHRTARAIFTQDCLRMIRRVRQKEGISIDEQDLAEAIRAMFSAEARERIGPMKIRRKAKPRKPAGAEPCAAPPAPEVSPGDKEAK